MPTHSQNALPEGRPLVDLDRRATRRSERGFTLVEIMVVIVILGLLATLVAKNVGGITDEANENKAQSDISSIADGVRMFYIRKNRLPESLDELVEKDEKGRSSLEALPDDPWGKPYVLLEGDTSRDFEIISCGPDGTEGNEDDLSSKPKDDDDGY
ncbi:MAG: type II secretion system protein GspG [Planctomycetota bacterium]